MIQGKKTAYPCKQEKEMTKNIKNLLAEFKSGLLELYGERLKGVYLFGSYARGDQDIEADVDVMIVLDQYDSYWEELKRTGELTSSLCLEYDLTISRVFVHEMEWFEGETLLMRNVRQEAIPA
jgi:predicted nucleotidyltransferase